MENIKTISQCKDELDIILQIEGGAVKVENLEELKVVKVLCQKLSMSQGFYGRLLRDLEEIEAADLPIIL